MRLANVRPPGRLRDLIAKVRKEEPLRGSSFRRLARRTASSWPYARTRAGVAPGRAPPPAILADQATVQGLPFRVNEVGLPALPVWVAWKPTSVVAPGASVPL